MHHLGFFDTEEAAARCYDAAVLQLRGPAAATNFQPSERAGKENPLKPSVLQNLTSASLPKYVRFMTACLGSYLRTCVSRKDCL